MQASSLEDLRVKLEKEGFSNISYVIVNHQGIPSRSKYMYLKSKVSEHIPVYQQEENQTDIWTLLNGKKDDFLIYDRCGRLVRHLSLPYSILNFPHVEEAIKVAYCQQTCGNCSFTTLDIEDFCKNVSVKTTRTTEAPEPQPQPQPRFWFRDWFWHWPLSPSQPSESPPPEAAPLSAQPPPPHLHHLHKLEGPQGQELQVN